MSSADTEAHDRALGAAVAVHARDPVGLPVVAAGAVEPEVREVAEARLELVHAVLVARRAPERESVADDAVAILAGRAADAHPHLAGAAHAGAERRRRAL